MTFVAKFISQINDNKVLVGLVALACIFRITIANQWPIVFFFDQARDAIQAQEILAGDIKLLGPSASGTLDTVYHGVIYYYLLAIAHAIFGTDPIYHTMFFGLLNSLAIVPVYFLGKSLHSRSTGIVAGLIYATSYDTARLGIG